MLDGDICIEDGDLTLVSDQEELKQNIENRLSINTKEWFLNLALGLEYERVQGKSISDRDIELAARKCVFQDERIKDLEIISITRNHVNRSVDVQINLIDKNNDNLAMGGVVKIE